MNPMLSQTLSNKILRKIKQLKNKGKNNLLFDSLIILTWKETH